MLGAKARAAEYNAAKAASARQQAIANPEEHQLPPKPTPMSLSTFTKNPSYNRNKGNKIFKPLILSEEDERSASSVEHGGASPGSLSPLPDPIGHRAASLPPPHTSTGTTDNAEHNVQTPFRYKIPPHVPFVPRTINTDDVLQYLPQNTVPVNYVPYAHNFAVPHQMVPYSHFGWYYPPDTSREDKYHSVRAPPSTPLNDPMRPSLQHNDTHLSNPEASKKVFEAVYATPRPDPIQQQPLENESKGEKEDDGETQEVRYIFHPDCVTPTKMEMKEKYRRELYENRQNALQTTPQRVDVKEMRTPESGKMIHHDDFLPSYHNDIHPEQVEWASGLLPTRMEHMNSKPHRPETEAQWPYLGFDVSSYQKTTEETTNHPVIRMVGTDEELEEEHISHLLLGSVLDIPPRLSQIIPPPGLEHRVIDGNVSHDSGSEESFGIDFPTTDIHTEEWCEVRPVTSSERQFTRDLMKNVAVSLPQNKYRTSYGNNEETKRKDLESSLDHVKQAQASQRARVNELAKEMQTKWEYGGHFRYSTMNTKEAKVHAGTVKAVASILSTLNSAPIDNNGLHLLGSRPYCHPPEYAIDRDTGPKQTGTHRHFEKNEEVNQPPRLARDPRFRQLGDELKPRANEERIPRMFSTIRRL